MNSETSLQWWSMIALRLIAAVAISIATIMALDSVAHAQAETSALEAPAVEAALDPAAE